MDAEILSIGTEVTRGAIADTNASYLSSELSVLGLDVRRHTAVSDRLDDIIAALGEACRRASVVLITGGLGPTLDDLTREGVAAVVGQPLETVPGEVERIRAFFQRRGREMPERNACQAQIPKGARVLANPRGTACGFWVRYADTDIIAMPGVPSEMRGMFADAVGPELARRYGDQGVWVEQVETFGLGESGLAEYLTDLMARGANPDVGTRVDVGSIAVRIIAHGTDRAAARALAEQTAAEIERRLGDVAFGRDGTTLEDAVGRELERTGVTIAIAESCTGGLVTDLLANVAGISRFLLEGLVTYSNEAKVRRLGVGEDLLQRHGAVSAPVAEAMARGVRKTSGADIGVGVTGIAGPSGGSAEKPVGLVYIAIADARGMECHEHHFAGDRQQVRQRAARTALNGVRLCLRQSEEVS